MLKALIADTHQLDREGLAQLVARLDEEVEVIQAGDWTEALERTQTDGPFALVLLGVDGEAEGIRAITAAAGDAAVVVMSATPNRREAEQALDAGAHGFLLKSAPESVLVSALKLVLLGETYVPGSVIIGRGDSTERVRPALAGALREARARVDRLTRRQCEVLALIGEGKSNRDIAARLRISEGTVKVHVGAILRALGTGNRTQAALLAIELGIVGEARGSGS